MRLLTRDNQSPFIINKSESILRRFVTKAAKLYGKAFVVYNVHSLIHLPDDYRTVGSLDKVGYRKMGRILGANILATAIHKFT